MADEKPFGIHTHTVADVRKLKIQFLPPEKCEMFIISWWQQQQLKGVLAIIFQLFELEKRLKIYMECQIAAAEKL